MKKLISLSIFTILVASGSHATTVVQGECSPEAKQALYMSFRENYKTNQAKANDDAKKYLKCPVSEVTEAERSVIDYLKKWTTAYDEALRKIRFRELLYNERKYPEAYALGAEILSKEPDNLKVLVDLGANGYLVGTNASLSVQALDYARRALQQLESGKTLDDWQPLTSREVAIAYLNYTNGALILSSDPSTALKHLVNAVQFETPLKKSPYTYAYIAGAYETGDYAKQSEEYKRLHAGKDETPESKLALANINQIVDRMIDGYARAIALAGTEPQFASAKALWLESLKTWYKFRNGNSDVGMSELIVAVLSKPLPPLPTRLTSLPQ